MKDSLELVDEVLEVVYVILESSHNSAGWCDVKEEVNWCLEYTVDHLSLDGLKASVGDYFTEVGLSDDEHTLNKGHGEDLNNQLMILVLVGAGILCHLPHVVGNLNLNAGDDDLHQVKSQERTPVSVHARRLLVVSPGNFSLRVDLIVDDATIIFFADSSHRFESRLLLISRKS